MNEQGPAWQGDPAPVSQGIEHAMATLWRRRRFFALCFAITLGAAALVTALLPSVYSSRVLLLVTPAQTAGSDFEATQISQTLAKTYAELLLSQSIADQVSTRLPFEAKRSEVLNAVEASPVSGSQLLQVDAEWGEADQAQTLADVYGEVFVERAEQLEAQEVGQARLTIADRASEPTSPSRPKPALYLAIGAVLATALAAAATLIRDRFAQGLGLAAGGTTVLDLPVLGRIPKSRALAGAMSGSGVAPNDSLHEPFRLLLANLRFSGVGHDPHSIAFVSPASGEGKTLIAATLARVAAEQINAVLLVDADLRRATLSLRLSDAGATRGLSTILSEEGGLVAPSEHAIEVPGSRAKAVLAGPPTANPAALLGSPALARFNSAAQIEYDLVCYDTPPVAMGADASLIARTTRLVVLVLDEQRTRRRAAVQALDQLGRAGATVVGVVINRAADAEGSRDYGGRPEPVMPAAEVMLSGTPEPGSPPARSARERLG